MKFAIQALSVALVVLSGCPKPEVAVEKKDQKPEIVVAPRTALGVIKEAAASLERDCGRELQEVDPEGLSELDLHEPEFAEAEKLLADVGLMAQQCGDYTEMKTVDGCSQDCSWCPIKWGWCIENAGACAGGDNGSCCKLGACGSKHHCETVCKSSCSCDVPPLARGGE